MKLPVDAFAYEVLHGAGLLESFFHDAMQSATKPMRDRYPRLERAIASAESALADLYQIAGEVWSAEAARAAHPDGLMAARAAASKGLCQFCEDPLPPRKGPGGPRVICGKVECRRAYYRAWRRDRRPNRHSAACSSNRGIEQARSGVAPSRADSGRST